jgi:hypothetical protein
MSDSSGMSSAADSCEVTMVTSESEADPPIMYEIDVGCDSRGVVGRASVSSRYEV